MIDGIKILNLIVNLRELLDNECLDFKGNHSAKTGDVYQYPLYSKYNELEFIIRDNSKQIKEHPTTAQRIFFNLNGSLHKYWNNGNHNYNDFHFTDLQHTIFDLRDRFNIDIDSSELNNLEFGVNVYIKQPPEEVFNAIINYKGTPFQKFNIKGAKGIECIMTNFIIKIYDKGHQYKLPGNLLRFEIKVIKMAHFKTKRIYINTLSDLLKYSEIYKLKDVLRGVFDDILFTDYTINTDNLNHSERLILATGNDPKHWVHLNPKSKNYTKGNKDKEYISKRKFYYRERDKFIKVVCKYSTSTMQKDISFLIEKKCTELLYHSGEIVDKFTDNLTIEKTTDSGQITTSYIVGYCPPSTINTRVCLTCQRDISDKKKIAKYCSKKCKNDFTNPLLTPKNNLIKKLKKIEKENCLFDVLEFVVFSEQQRELLNRKNTIQNYVSQ